VIEGLSAAGDDRLEPLLDRLLSMKADDLVGDLGISGTLVSGGGGGRRLAGEGS
jgi:hypothetical protein